MKRILTVLLIFTFALSPAINIYAEEVEPETEETSAAVQRTDTIDYKNTPIEKLGRGAINVATCWTEVPAAISKTSKETNPVIGFTLGALQGTLTGFVRCMGGVMETLTFIIPPYNKPVTEPAPVYALKDADAKVKDFLW